ncbi:MAG: ABC transporter permease [Chthonomonadales bacterium]
MADPLAFLVGVPLLVPILSRAAPLALAGLGGIVSERAGVVNIALEGMMLIGAFVGILVGQHLGIVGGLIAAVIAGIATGGIHYLLTQKLLVDQVVSGVAINLLALQGTTFLLRTIYGPTSGKVPYITTGIPTGFFIALTIVLVFATNFVLFKTTFGLRLRAAGESPVSARMSGLNPQLLRLWAVLLSGAFASLGGAYLSLSLTTRFSDNMVSGRGFIALAAVICGRWNPLGMAVGAVVFGLLDAIQVQLQGNVALPGEVLRAIPYLFTILAAMLLRPRAPLALGKVDLESA